MSSLSFPNNPAMRPNGRELEANGFKSTDRDKDYNWANDERLKQIAVRLPNTGVLSSRSDHASTRPDFWWGDGSKLYLDGEVLEVAQAETFGSLGAAAQKIRLEEKYSLVCEAFPDTLEASSHLCMHSNVTNCSTGAHENYTINKQVSETYPSFRHAMELRGLIAGTGRYFLYPDGKALYEIAPKAFNPSKRWRGQGAGRLEIGIGEHNVLCVAEATKTLYTSLLIQAREDALPELGEWCCGYGLNTGRNIPRIVNSRVRAWGFGISLPMPREDQGCDCEGALVGLIKIFRDAYFERLDPIHQEIFLILEEQVQAIYDLSRSGLKTLANLERLIDRCDWARKLYLIETFIAEAGISESEKNLRRQAFDLEYHRIGVPGRTQGRNRESALCPYETTLSLLEHHLEGSELDKVIRRYQPGRTRVRAGFISRLSKLPLRRQPEAVIDWDRIEFPNSSRDLFRVSLTSLTSEYPEWTRKEIVRYVRRLQGENGLSPAEPAHIDYANEFELQEKETMAT